MKKVCSVLVAILLAIVPAVFAVDVGGGIGVNIETENFAPMVWLCDSRVVLDDPIEPGRISGSLDFLAERINNYAFEGEVIIWNVLVFDKNGIEKVKDVYVTLGSTQGTGNDIEANCNLVHILTPDEQVDPSCNARVLEEQVLNVSLNTAAYYTCILSVETPDSMQGEYFITVEAEDLDGLLGIFDENEYWFLNPEIALSISDSTLDFGDNVRPGTASYSQTLLLGNDAEPGSGVLLDMYIAATDFYDPASSGAKCPISNVLAQNPVDKGLLALGGCPSASPYCVDNMPTGLAYYATNGAYSTALFFPHGPIPSTNANYAPDVEGYMRMPYGDRIDQSKEIVGTELFTQTHPGPFVGYIGNVLAPGAEMAITFRLTLPEPCNGDFSDGDIFFWGEAI